MRRMEPLIHDLRYALRSLLRQPSFALTAVLTLALGIGATTAIFSVVNAVLLQPLPFERPDRLVAITNYWTKTGSIGSTVSAPDFFDWEAQNQSFASLAYFNGGETSLTVDGTADYAFAYLVTPRFFETLGVRAAKGRLLTTEELAAGGPPAAVISDSFWQRQYNRDERAIGSVIKYADRMFTVTGVLPPGVRYPARAEIYFPAWLRPPGTSRSAHNYSAIGRLKDGVRTEQADVEMRGIASRLEQQYPASNAGKLDVGDLAARTARRIDAQDPLRAARRGRAGVAHRLRQRREPAAGAVDGAASVKWWCGRRSGRRAAGWSGSCSPKARCSASCRGCSGSGWRGSA